MPCLTLRENTERPVTIEVGCNQLVGQDPARILSAYRMIMNGGVAAPGTPPLWDGMAAGRIVDVLKQTL